VWRLSAPSRLLFEEVINAAAAAARLRREARAAAIANQRVMMATPFVTILSIVFGIAFTGPKFCD
jgi:hypothetical protein